MGRFFISDAPQVERHLVFTDDFNYGYYNMIDRINSGCNIDDLARQLRGDATPNRNSMSDYFYNKGQWAAILDNKF